MEAEFGIYVYSIIASALPRTFGRIGIGGRGNNDVFTVQHRGLAAVVSRAPLVLYEPTRENMLAHEHVNEVVIEQGFTPVPLSFGSLFRTDDEIAAFLETSHDALRDLLVKMHDRLEFGLRVTWALDEVLAEIERDDYVRAIFEHVGEVVIASRSNKPIGDKMIVNAAFLVERTSASAFTRRVDEIAEQYSGKLGFRATGPWPPYNFVSVRLPLDPAQVV